MVDQVHTAEQEQVLDLTGIEESSFPGGRCGEKLQGGQPFRLGLVGRQHIRYVAQRHDRVLAAALPQQTEFRGTGGRGRKNRNRY
jgi:hypothetical protein